MVLLAIPFGAAIGLALGMLGGGGSVLAVPVLVYVLGQDVHEATTASLIVVSAAALAGGAAQARGAEICWPQVGTFAPTAAVATFAGAAANGSVGEDVLLGGFAAVMLVAAWFTWRRADETGADDGGTCPPLHPARTIGAGVVVGVMTGFFGVGGGFLVVPLLALTLRFPIRQAIGTSLVIVAFVSMAGAVAHLLRGNGVEADVTIALTVACAAGAVAGGTLAARVSQEKLGHAFALMLVTVAAWLAVSTAFLGGAS